MRFLTPSVLSSAVFAAVLASSSAHAQGLEANASVQAAPAPVMTSSSGEDNVFAPRGNL